ncbi:aldo/keto reductase [Streptomyces sp. NPDC006530]|uniref:aldo/keto reductase n=1 Tax=Streptomyces sp. NPDC006530 TaxID=3364750 RepID=UPI0036B19358
MSLTLDTYRLLGRSGLRVSPLALGAATFGTEWDWGAEPDEARKLFDLYVERGGNFIDTASTYTNGSSERLLGEFARGNRQSLVLATKFSTLRRPGDPNSGGNHRKAMFASVEASLRRLNTDYLDLLYLHVWDAMTPVEEFLRAMDDLVRQGKVLYAGICNVPAWQVSRMQTIADLRGWSPLVALQTEYNLAERSGERDLFPMAREMGLGVAAFSPLAGGLLTGKYTRADLTAPKPDTDTDSTRKEFNLANGALTERTLALADVVKDIAAEQGTTPGRIALAWPLQNPDVTAPIIGARTPAQLEDNLGALEIEFTPAQCARLEQASAISLGFPHDFLAGERGRTMNSGDLMIEPRR